MRKQSNKRSGTMLVFFVRACEASAFRARKTFMPRFTDFFTDFKKKNRLFCSLFYILHVFKHVASLGI